MRGVGSCGERNRRRTAGTSSTTCRWAPRVLGRRARHGDRHGRALLQQQLRRLDDRLGAEPSAHRRLEQHVGQGDDRHPLVMGHVRLHDFELDALGKPRRRVVDRFVEAVSPERADGGEPPEVLARGRGVDHGGERRGVGRHDEILGEPALQAEADDAEVRVLVGEVHVARVVSRFRDSPGNAALLPVLNLPPHREAVRVLEEAPGRRLEHEVGHQVLEHRPGPGEQRRAAADRAQGTAEVKPVLDGHVAAGDGHEARQSRLRGQQIVVSGVQRPVLRAIADREEILGRVVEKREVHLLREARRRAGGRGEARPRAAGRARENRPARRGRACGSRRTPKAPAPTPGPRRAVAERVVLAQGAHDVEQRFGARAQGRQSRRPLGKRRRRGREQHARLAQRLLELAGRDDAVAAAPGSAGKGVRGGARACRRHRRDRARSEPARRPARGRPA